MSDKTRRKYSPEFKREAVELASQPGRTITGVAANAGDQSRPDPAMEA